MDKLQKDLNIKPIHAAAILGNLGFESGGFTQLHELGQPAGQGGYGAAQWTGPRHTQFFNWCAMHGGIDWKSDEANYGFLIHELQTTQAHSLEHLKTTNNLEAAVFTFGYYYEAPGGTTAIYLPGQAGRMEYAQRALRAEQPSITAIKAIQTILGVEPDGDFGPISQAALDALIK
jgi:hypothetical protein